MLFNLPLGLRNLVYKYLEPKSKKDFLCLFVNKKWMREFFPFIKNVYSNKITPLTLQYVFDYNLENNTVCNLYLANKEDYKHVDKIFEKKRDFDLQIILSDEGFDFLLYMLNRAKKYFNRTESVDWNIEVLQSYDPHVTTFLLFKITDKYLITGPNFPYDSQKAIDFYSQITNAMYVDPQFSDFNKLKTNKIMPCVDMDTLLLHHFEKLKEFECIYVYSDFEANYSATEESKIYRKLLFAKKSKIHIYHTLGCDDNVELLFHKDNEYLHFTYNITSFSVTHWKGFLSFIRSNPKMKIAECLHDRLVGWLKNIEFKNYYKNLKKVTFENLDLKISTIIELSEL